MVIQQAVPRPRPIAILTLCRRYQIDMAHARHVADLSAQLFDLSSPLHALDPRWREMAHLAGLLHNVAYAEGVQGHHTRGRDILLATPLTRISETERTVIAIAAAFHRKAWKPQRLEKEAAYHTLSEPDQQAALWVSALVRLADGLDYSHSQTTVIDHAEVTPQGIFITLGGPFVQVDGPRAEEKADLWRVVTPTPLHFAAPGVIFSAGEIPASAFSEVGRAVLREQLDRFTASEPGMREGSDPEPLHKMRVAIRRMRTALVIFGEGFEPQVIAWLNPRLRELGRYLSRVRDFDVLPDRIQPYLDTLDAAEQSTLVPLLERWSARRQRARRTLIDALNSDETRDLLRQFYEFCQTPGAGVRLPVVDGIAPAGAQLRVHSQAVLSYDPLVSQASPLELHQLRIEVKRLRYLIESFSKRAASDGKQALPPLVSAQDLLGHHHDLNVLRARLWKVMDRAVRRGRQGKAPDYALIEALAHWLRWCDSEMVRLHTKFITLWADLSSVQMQNWLEGIALRLEEG